MFTELPMFYSPDGMLVFRKSGLAFPLRRSVLTLKLTNAALIIGCIFVFLALLPLLSVPAFCAAF